MRDRGRRESDSAAEDGPQRPPRRGARNGEFPDADDRERRRRRGGEPEVGVLDAACDPRERFDEEDVVRAVVPAVGVEEGIAEQRPAERGQDSFDVHGEDEGAHTLRTQSAGRVSDDKVEQEREREAGGQRSEAEHERRPAPPAGPKRREPDNTGKERQVTDASRRSCERRDEAGRHERKTSRDGKSGSEVGAPSVGRELARAARDRERPQSVGERGRPGGESGEVRRPARETRHGPIVAPLTMHTLVLATAPLSEQPRWCALPASNVVSIVGQRIETMSG
jgi:hypothetical protein